MELLLILSHPGAGAIAEGLAGACDRSGIEWGVFVTNDGVKALADAGVTAALAKASQSIVCQESWGAHMPGTDCPLTEGSQTSNSAMVGEAARIVSL